jgi:hypothetical protein
MTEKHGHAEEGYERRDVDAGSLLRAFSWIVLTTIVVIFLLWRLYFVFVAQEAARQPPPPILKAEPGALAPPAPRLQSNPVLDLRAFREQEDRILGTYGWVDEERQVVRIPIEEAMRLLALRGIPPVAPRPGTAKPAAKAAGGEK